MKNIESDKTTVIVTRYETTVTLNFAIKADEYLVIDSMNLKKEIPLSRSPEQHKELSDKLQKTETEIMKQIRERKRPYKELEKDIDYKGKIYERANHRITIVKGTRFTQDNVPPYVKELADRKSHWIAVKTETHTGVIK